MNFGKVPIHKYANQLTQQIESQRMSTSPILRSSEE